MLVCRKHWQKEGIYPGIECLKEWNIRKIYIPGVSTKRTDATEWNVFVCLFFYLLARRTAVTKRTDATEWNVFFFLLARRTAVRQSQVRFPPGHPHGGLSALSGTCGEENTEGLQRMKMGAHVTKYDCLLKMEWNVCGIECLEDLEYLNDELIRNVDTRRKLLNASIDWLKIRFAEQLRIQWNRLF